jgi:uncharacterized protein involved in response to NO
MLVAAWTGLLLALVANLASVVTSPDGNAAGGVLAVPSLGVLSTQLALLAWLVPLSVAFSARNFPLFLWTGVSSARSLRLGLAMHVAGLALGGAGAGSGDSPALASAGTVLVAVALLWWGWAIGALRRKVRLPGTTTDPLEASLFRLSRGPLTGAYAWLVVTGALLLGDALATVLGLPPPPADAVRHAVGAGFLLLLITGMALRLVPGFAGPRRRVNLGAARIAVWAAQAAALLRVAPVLLGWLLALAGTSPLPGVPALLSLAGVAGMVAVGALWVALWGSLTRSADPHAA